MAPQVGFEPTTCRLTAECSTAELLRNVGTNYNNFLIFQLAFYYLLLFKSLIFTIISYDEQSDIAMYFRMQNRS